MQDRPLSQRIYISSIAKLRATLVACGLLVPLEKAARHSRLMLYLRSLLSIDSPEDMIHLDIPWWSFAVTDCIEAHLAQYNGQARVFEYGSGASTVWLARRCGRLTTVEHDSEFYQGMQQLLQGLSNIQYLLIPPQTHAATETNSDTAYSQRRGCKGLNFSRYARAILADSGEFDLIIIDGRARASCLRNAVTKVAPGGMIVLDNSTRYEYRAAISSCSLTSRCYGGLTPGLPYPSWATVFLNESGENIEAVDSNF